MTKLKKLEGPDENDVKKLVLDWFKAHNGWSYAPIQRGLGEGGIPDRVGCVPVLITSDMVGQTIGLFVGLESKRPGRTNEKNGGASDRQAEKLIEIAEASGLAYVVDGTRDLDTASYLLSAIRYDAVRTTAASYWKNIVLGHLKRRLRRG